MDNLKWLQYEVSAHLEKIAKMFTQHPKITIVIRTPWMEAAGKDGGILLTDDDLDLAIAEIARLRAKKPFEPESDMERDRR